MLTMCSGVFHGQNKGFEGLLVSHRLRLIDNEWKSVFLHSGSLVKTGEADHKIIV